jgi:MFS family permease
MSAAQKAPGVNLRAFIFTRQFLFIFIVAFFIYCSNSMLMITLPRFAHEMGAGSQAIGLLAGIFAMCALLMRPISGQVVDYEDKLVMLRVVIVVVLVSVFGLTLSTKYWMLLIFRGLNGFAWGVGSTLCMTIASSCFTEVNMASGIGMYGLGQVLAQTLAPMISLPVAEKLGYNTLYYGNVALMIISLVLTFFMRIEHRPKKRQYSISFSKMICVPAITPATLTLVNASVKSAISAFLVIYAGTLDVSGIGLYFTVQAATIFILRPWVSRLADKLGSLKVLIPCEILLVIGMILIARATTLPMFLTAAVVMGLSLSGEQPILMALCVKSVDQSRRGSASNTSYVGVDIGNVIGSNLAGLLVALVGYSSMFLVITLPVILYTAIFARLYVNRRK